MPSDFELPQNACATILRVMHHELAPYRVLSQGERVTDMVGQCLGGSRLVPGIEKFGKAS
jgi:hypothetical protein